MTIINMSHGSGGVQTARLIKDVFLSAFGNALGDGVHDATVLNTGGALAFTSDSFVVKPLFFKGGDIGRLAVCGTVNDLLTAGARPMYLSASFIIEEGLEMDALRRVALSMAEAAREAGVFIVTGDTKVIEGSGGLYISTSGIGTLDGAAIDCASARADDVLIVTGNIGDHHACIMSARMGIDNDIVSDAAPLCSMVSALRDTGIVPRGMRDITRGGLATVLCEISALCGVGARIQETALPVSQSVVGLCAILGLDPLYMSNEGNMLVIVAPEHADDALRAIRAQRYGRHAARIGELCGQGVRMMTRVGSTRVIGPLAGESLPRIC